jgi:hypothetical protein
MAKSLVAVGYSHTVRTTKGVAQEVITEKPAYADIFRSQIIPGAADSVNTDLTVNNSVSFVADAYASANVFAIRYVDWAGTVWKVAEATVQGPRLVLRLAGVYTGKRPQAGVTP